MPEYHVLNNCSPMFMTFLQTFKHCWGLDPRRFNSHIISICTVLEMTSDKTLHLLTHSKITTIKQKYHIFMENNYSFLNKNNLGEKSGILHFFFFFFCKTPQYLAYWKATGFSYFCLHLICYGITQLLGNPTAHHWENENKLKANHILLLEKSLMSLIPWKGHRHPPGTPCSP